MPTKLAVKLKRGRLVVVYRDVPSMDEVKKMWREGKTAQQILEQSRKKSHKERKQNEDDDGHSGRAGPGRKPGRPR